MPEQLYTIIVIFLAFAYLFYRVRKNNSIINAQKDELRKLHSNQPVFLCDELENLGDGLVQFYGEPLGISIRPGMRIQVPNGREYTVKEVYADDDTPDKPDPEITNTMKNATIVIETDASNLNIIRQNFVNNKVIVLKILN